MKFFNSFNDSNIDSAPESWIELNLKEFFLVKLLRNSYKKSNRIFFIDSKYLRSLANSIAPELLISLYLIKILLIIKLIITLIIIQSLLNILVSQTNTWKKNLPSSKLNYFFILNFN